MSPITAKWRCVTVEVNGPVTIANVPVRAGDLVIADETGTCFVPSALIEKVLPMAEAITHSERAVMRTPDEGHRVPALARNLFGRGGQKARPIGRRAGRVRSAAPRRPPRA